MPKLGFSCRPGRTPLNPPVAQQSASAPSEPTLRVWTVQQAQACRVGSIVTSVFSTSFPALTELPVSVLSAGRPRTFYTPTGKSCLANDNLAPNQGVLLTQLLGSAPQTLQTRGHLLAAFIPPASSHPNPFYSISDTLQVTERCLRTGSVA